MAVTLLQGLGGVPAWVSCLSRPIKTSFLPFRAIFNLIADTMKNYSLPPGRQWGIFQGAALPIVCIVDSSLLIFNWGKFPQRPEVTRSHGDNGGG